MQSGQILVRKKSQESFNCIYPYHWKIFDWLRFRTFSLMNNVQIKVCVEIYITESCTITCDIIMKNYSAPSSLAEMTSWLLLLSKVAFPLIKVTEILLKSWLVGSLSSQPFFLARACPSRLTTSVATQWNPPRVSTARGKNLSPWVLHASAVSLIFRS